jgi:hypothetical protein
MRRDGGQGEQFVGPDFFIFARRPDFGFNPAS